ncbi:hypothetical protein FJY90_06660 [Candidatus Gottesmanbacteria bacterium]|nr:hypothetical protein [Candidatus Gottesmanbacteria bacterium]
MLYFAIILFTVFIAGSSSISNTSNSPLFPTPQVKKTTPTSQYCLTREELAEIKSRPVAFVCDRTDIDGTTILEKDVPYVLAAEDVEVKKIFIHEEKQLILKETCSGINYYTWKCHPPSWGSIFSNTLWKLKDTNPNRAPLVNGDHFDVYIRQDVKDTERFVCKNQAALSVAQAITAEVNIFADSPLEGEIINVLGKRATWYLRSDALKMDIEDAPPRKKAAEIDLKGKNYDIFVNLLKAFSPDEDKNLYLVEKGILPEGNDNLPDSITYDVFAIVTEVKPKGKTLQLGTFNPIPPTNRWFDIYLPESKPVIYLYPPKPTQLTVKIEPKEGFLTISDPPYDPKRGWEVLALPDGTLKQVKNEKLLNRTFPYLYYESEVKGYPIPQEGFVVEKWRLKDFFRRTLPILGLNDKETADFSSYWLDRLFLLDKFFFFISFFSTEQIDQIDPIIASVQPDNTIRIRAYIKPLEIPISVKPQFLLPPPNRAGFTLVEWGGILDER